MDRRNFLKNSGLLAIALTTRLGWESPPGFANTTAVGATVYRGDAAGNIFVSRDAGRTWQVQARFGPRCPVIALYQDKARQVYARLAHAGRSFDLFLAAEANAWRAV